MTVRKMPPGRRSISHSTVFHGAGQNQCLICSGTVHAAQTSSGGTSTTRSRRRSRRGLNCGAAVIPSPPSVQQIAVELVEAALPERSLSGYPALGGFERLRREAVGAHA